MMLHGCCKLLKQTSTLLESLLNGLAPVTRHILDDKSWESTFESLLRIQEARESKLVRGKM